MQMKLGLTQPNPKLVKSFWEILEKTGGDFTNTFRTLSEITKEGKQDIAEKLVKFSGPKAFFEKKYKHPYADDQNMQIILRKQPDMLRLYGIDPDKLKKDLERSEQLLSEVNENFETQIKPQFKILWQEWIAEYKQALDSNISDADRKTKMDQVNPSFILRNYLLEQAIRLADGKGDFSMVHKLLEQSENPYQTSADPDFTKVPPSWAQKLCVSCSS